MLTYDLDDAFVSLSQTREKLAALAESDADCIGTLCALTDTGEWMRAGDGTMEYRCDTEGEEELGLSDGVDAPVAAYRVGGDAIPTKVARKLGLGEYVVCENTGYLLQGISDQPIHVVGEDGEVCEETTTLNLLVAPSGDIYDAYFTKLEWRHVQRVVDPDGGQSARYRLVSEILDRLIDAYIDSSTFIPYGHQFADSDFL